LLRNAERKLGVCGRLADVMPDRREASRIRHAMFEMVMARLCAIACGHEDAIDLDRLRHDPLMKVAVGRCPQSGGLENAPRKTEAARLTAALLDQFGDDQTGCEARKLYMPSAAALPPTSGVREGAGVGVESPARIFDAGDDA
jgi:hypothetical protein